VLARLPCLATSHARPRPPTRATVVEILETCSSDPRPLPTHPRISTRGQLAIERRRMARQAQPPARGGDFFLGWSPPCAPDDRGSRPERRRNASWTSCSTASRTGSGVRGLRRPQRLANQFSQARRTPKAGSFFWKATSFSWLFAKLGLSDRFLPLQFHARICESKPGIMARLWKTSLPTVS